eukprot:1180304-Prorocentrum_minimum.AAC.4
MSPSMEKSTWCADARSYYRSGHRPTVQQTDWYIRQSQSMAVRARCKPLWTRDRRPRPVDLGA